MIDEEDYKIYIFLGRLIAFLCMLVTFMDYLNRGIDAAEIDFLFMKLRFFSSLLPSILDEGIFSMNSYDIC